jgi:hypothetical protein
MSLLVDISVIVGYIVIPKNDGGRVIWTIGRLLRRIQMGNSSCCDAMCLQLLYCNGLLALPCLPYCILVGARDLRPL